MKLLESFHAIPSVLISFLIDFLKMNEFKWRGLTDGEVVLAQSVFGELIDYHAVKNL